MKINVWILAVFAALFFAVMPAHADACSAAARAMVGSYQNATLLSVRSGTDGNGQLVCEARIKIASQNGNPPRVVVKRFRP